MPPDCQPSIRGRYWSEVASMKRRVGRWVGTFVLAALAGASLAGCGGSSRHDDDDQVGTQQGGAGGSSAGGGKGAQSGSAGKGAGGASVGGRSTGGSSASGDAGSSQSGVGAAFGDLVLLRTSGLDKVDVLIMIDN